MSWADVYLICFIVGFSLSVISVLGGFFDLHFPGVHHDAHVHIGGIHLPYFNFSTIAAFLAWFGGVGYLLARFSGLWLWAGFVFAMGGGLVGGSIVFLFLTKVLLAHERPMDTADYDMIGVLGQLTSPIREGGTGEMAFSQSGSRRSAPARSEEGAAIPKGVDVVVTRYEKGIAYVRRWEDLNE